MFVAVRIAPAARANFAMSTRLQSLHRLFAAVDADHSGQLSTSEFFAVIEPLVGTLDDFERRYLFHAFDFTRDGSIDLAEFDYALFHDLQVSEDDESVQKVLVDKMQQKLAVFRAMTPEQRGALFAPDGILNDSNAAAKQQAEIQKQQASGQGAHTFFFFKLRMC